MPLDVPAFPRLIALTEQARRAAGGAVILLDQWPFRVGREGRSGAGRAVTSDRRHGAAPAVNDLFLREDDEIFHISREHFRIEPDGDMFALVDAGSLNGTIVEGCTLGGDRAGGRVTLRDHDVIIIGSAASPYIFKFRV